VLADFGGAARLQDLSAVTSSYTPMYAPPELLCGEAASAASDVWSMSSTLYAALTGRSPFAGDGSGGLAGALSRVVSAPPPPTGRTDVPAALEGLLRAGLAKRPEDRPTALEFAVEAQRAQETAGFPATEIPGSTSVHAPRTPVAAAVAAPVQQPGPPALEESATVLRPAPDTRRRRWSTRRIAAAVGSALGGAVVAAAVLQPLQSVATTRLEGPVKARTTAAPRSPAPAGSLAVVGLTRTSIALNWVDTNGGTSRYVVLVARASGPVSEQAASEITSHTLGSLRPGTDYCVRVATVAGSARPVTPPVCVRTLG
jgi:protein kinase-like protein/fibronectin type III domain protein